MQFIPCAMRSEPTPKALLTGILALQVILTNPGNGGSSLTNRDKLIELYASSYNKSLPLSGTTRRLATTGGTYLTAAQLQQLFSRVAEVGVLQH
jgi:hypothetical protein